MNYSMRVWQAMCEWSKHDNTDESLPAIAKAYGVTEWDVELEYRESKAD